ncbi:hypothetical protein JM18_003213 [Phytophthora kernoviae]|uniref:Uncharacterized protein n=2 Tax=Phytophthora kernoviae TaxID=325452 RepID=A0A921VBE7_9STRA|nr:hypothetical protein G195_004290 [Phytophthora kernoviae 00238/432]KAG2528635.1 hypothetical protein JM18_003213 [Phytophthora kernoviae]
MLQCSHFRINSFVALNAKTNSDDVIFRGMALLSPAGCRPHRVLRPRESAMVVRALRLGNPVINGLVSHLIKMIYTRVLLFPSDLPPGHYLAGLVRAATTDFDVLREQVNMLKHARLPALLAWSRSDEFMEEEIPVELSQLCHTGPRLAFAGGGHNIQKTRAEKISTVLSEWVERVLAGENVEEEEPTRYLP